MLTSPNDHRSYRYLTLENGLRVLLAEDPQATKSAIALAVNVGHFNDPFERQGMSHLLEHMLFLGTEKYPNAEDYQKFISTHGGNHNGWTGTEHSCYFFDIDHQQFLPALDRFAQFFIAPLLDPGWLEKERQSIDAEYRMKIKDDVRRLFQVHKETINPAHPFAKFSVGDLETLADREGSELATELRDYFAQNYHAGNMTLCMLSAMPLAEQIEAISVFDGVRSGETKPSLVKEPLYRPEDQGITLLVKPQKTVRKLIMSFAMPEVDSCYRTKPVNFISHLLGDEGSDSLLAQLKANNWVSSMSAGGGINGSNFKDFNIEFLLTEQGLGHVPDIVEHTFALINEIKANGLEDWRYAEKKQLTEQAFRFQEKGRPIDLVGHLAVNMQHYNEEDVIYGDYRMEGLIQAEANARLALLKPENMRLYVIAPEVNTDREAKLYFTHYSVFPFDEEMLTSWKQPKVSLRPHVLPPPNPYLVAANEPREVAQPLAHPVRLVDQPHFRLWHKQEEKFNQPKGHLYLSVDSPYASRNPTEIAMLRLAVEMILDNLSETTYPAEIAGLSYHIYAHQCGVTLHLAGFTGKQRLLLETLLQHLYYPEFHEQSFVQLKSQLLRHWKNAEKNRPVSQLFSELAALLQPANPGPRRLADEIQNVTLPQLRDYVDSFKVELHLEMMIHGDWLADEAAELGNWVQQRLFSHARPGKGCPRELLNIGGLGTLHRQLEVPHNDAALVVYYQSTLTSPNKVALFLLLNHLLSSPFFHELRTQQQLGYMVGTGYLPMQRHPGLIMYLQSPNNGPNTLLSAVDEFLKTFPAILEQMSDEEWQHAQLGLINQVIEPDNNLRTLAQRYWVSIGNKDIEFNQREHVAKHIQGLTKQRIQRFVEERLLSTEVDRVVLYSHGEQDPTPVADKDVTHVENIAEFKLMCERFVLN
ncbi:insulinase family protein [Corallincola holothuriorum]|uniref:Protease 3 n=1 Tax=Corallincola holothuriorum TaxID=2282215 RepID=A0A368NE33_9GAMM|nr:insulinase family protein [Corallincola holothuriorum]RCU48907.1 insulinase family protein [Corallincola holothuriorum]